jgi:hypothetical protein
MQPRASLQQRERMDALLQQLSAQRAERCISFVTSVVRMQRSCEPIARPGPAEPAAAAEVQGLGRPEAQHAFRSFVFGGPQ